MEHAPNSGAEAASPAGSGRKDIILLLTVVAVSIVGARIATAPIRFSGNDTSRWATIRALVDTGDYSIGRREQRPDGTYQDAGIIAEDDWDTVDVVMHPETRRFYSSKPTLLPTLLAGEYWVLRHALNLDFERHRRAVTRAILLTINFLPFVLYLVLFARLVERLGTTDWGRVFVFMSVAFGTFISGFLGSLNNHTVAAMSVLFAVYQCLCIYLDCDRRWWRFVLTGLCLGWAACNELPSAALALIIVLWLVRRSTREVLRWAVPAMLLPLAGYALTQYLALGSLTSAYAQAAWYDFEGSYFSAPVGLDTADEPKIIYAMHLLVGHMGILSLTPVLLLGWIGMVRTTRDPHGAVPEQAARRMLAVLTLALTTLTFGYYVLRSQTYGGYTTGPRWFFWLVPLWLLTALPIADRWALDARRRRLAAGLLAFSVATASYALANPWQPSPLLILLRSLGGVSY